MKYVNHLQNLINILKKKKIKICIAESLTGGKVAYEFVKKKGASAILDFSIVCYSNDSKDIFFNVDNIIKKYGVVSKETAEAMLKSMEKFSKSKNRLRMSCTGYASQNSSNEKVDVGIVYIGLSLNKEIRVIKKKFKNNGRVNIINSTVKTLVYEGLKIIDQ